jgi:hypothetical protein
VNRQAAGFASTGLCCSRARTWVGRGVAVLFAICVSLTLADGAFAGLPDDRGYELVSPVMKNGLSPYAAIPGLDGGAVDFQARGAFSGSGSGSLSLYQATRTSEGWHTMPLTPTPTSPLGALEEQVPVWLSPDLTETIFTTPTSYSSGDKDGGALSLYEGKTASGLTFVSQGSQGENEPKQVTFDGAAPDGTHVVFSSGASLLPSAFGLGQGVLPEPEYLYQRDLAGAHTSLLSLDEAGRPAGSAVTRLSAEYTPGNGLMTVARAEGFVSGQFITVGEGPEAETTQIASILFSKGSNEQLTVGNGSGLPNAHPAGTPVTHAASGSILGDGGHLTSGPSPAGEYLPADAESGSTTNAIADDGSKVFFESPNPSGGEPVALYMRKDNTTTVKIAGAAPDGSIFAGVGGGVELTTFGSARYEGAAADGSLAFFRSDEGLAGASNKGTELYAFNTTGHAIGTIPPLSVHPVSGGLNGDREPATTTLGENPTETNVIHVASTAGFHVGETIAFGRFETNSPEHNGGLTLVIASVDSPTELTTTAIINEAGAGIPEGTEVYGVHPASMTAISNDGSRVYFISDGILAANANAEGAKAVPVEPNLYVYDTVTDETTFIATVAENDVKSPAGSPTGLADEPDISRPAIPTPNGGVLVFASAANLTGQNPWQEFTEIYRYAVAGNTLECLSCTAPGVKPAGNATFGETAGGTYDPPGLTSPISEDGSRVFFDTPDSLVPEDTNGGAPLSAKFETPTSTDVYEAEGGQVFLLSSGKATTPAVLQGTTPSGDDVLFTTTAQMAPQDTDGGYENVWDARVGGGFPLEAGGKPSCVGASCRAAFGVAPVFSAPASTTPQSAGSPPAAKPTPKPPACRKGFVRKRVKGKLVCVRKRAGKASHASRQADRGARASRARALNGRRSR